MPSISKKQHNLMAAAAHNPQLAKKAGVPVKVAKEFVAADKGKTFKKGGETMDKKDLAQDKKIVKKAVSMHDKQLHGGKKTNLTTLKKGGCTTKRMASGGLAAGHKSADGIASKGKTKARAVAMCGGGKAKGK